MYLGYDRRDKEWLSFWQHGWHLASKTTPAEEIVHAPPNLSTTFIALLGLRLVTHRISPELPRKQRRAAHAWLRVQVRRSWMVPIATASTHPPSVNMDEAAVKRGMWALREFVVMFTRSVAPTLD